MIKFAILTDSVGRKFINTPSKSQPREFLIRVIHTDNSASKHSCCEASREE